MSANELLTLTTQVFFILLGIITAADFLYYRDEIRRSVALMFWSVTFPLLVGFIARVMGTTTAEWLSILNLVAFVSQPYLLLRLVRYLRPVPANISKAAFIAMVGSWIALLVFPMPRPQVLNLVIIAYFVLVDTYAMFAFVRGALKTYGVTRQRLRFTAAGSGLFALALFFLGIGTIPGLEGVRGLVQIVAIASAVMFYIGFAPPRWLRRTWQLAELNNYLIHMSNRPVTERLDSAKNLTELCYVANRAVGGIGAGIVQKDKVGWVMRYKIGEVTELPLSGDETLSESWKGGLPKIIHRSNILLRGIGADTLLLTPIIQRETTSSLLLVFLRYSSLFIEDDLNSVTLLARQSALFLENGTMVEQLQDYSERLQQTLQLTETLYDTSHYLLTSKGYDQSLKAVLRYASQTHATAVALFTIEVDNSGKPEWATNIGGVGSVTRTGPPIGTRYRIDDIPFMKYWINAPNEVLLIEDIDKDPRIDQRTRDIMRQVGLNAMVLLPLVLNGTWLGLLTINWAEPHNFGTFDKQFYTALSSLFTTVLESERLRLAEREALTQLAATNRELEAFSYSVSHDLRTPLRSLDGFSQALLEDYADCLDQDGRDYLDRIRSASQRMGELIDDLLNLSRLSRTEMRFEQVDLSKIVHQIVGELKQRPQAQKVEFVVAEEVSVSGDARLLQIALFNLLDNAWKFTGKQSRPRIEFGMTYTKEGPTYFVRDNGAGFDMAYVNKLFGAFQRLHHMTDFEGTGVGLATVQRIIHRHGGKIWAEAGVNQGATFYFTLAP